MSVQHSSITTLGIEQNADIFWLLLDTAVPPSPQSSAPPLSLSRRESKPLVQEKDTFTRIDGNLPSNVDWHFQDFLLCLTTPKTHRQAFSLSASRVLGTRAALRAVCRPLRRLARLRSRLPPSALPTRLAPIAGPRHHSYRPSVQPISVEGGSGQNGAGVR